MSNTATYLATSAGVPDYMAPEVNEGSIPMTDRVDIWSLGCILYRMVTGSLLFHDRRDLLVYGMLKSSPPPVVQKRGFSVACEDFLRDVLQTSPGDRPSAEGCLKTGWITSGDLGSGGRLGSDIYRRLSKIALAAPDIDTFSDMAAHQGAGKTTAPSSETCHSSGSGAALRGKLLCLQDDGEKLTTRRLVDRTFE